MNEKIFSVTEVTRMVRETLESRFPSVWIRGEISNYRKTASGHVYFTIKDENSQISAVIFRTFAMKFCTPDIGDGVLVRVFGGISVYEKSGNYQIICSRIENAGIGELQIQFLRLKEKLYKMGWFDAARKKPIPFLPEQIAIVTSKEGAAVRDMINIIFMRMPNARVVIFPVRVQGAGASLEIASAIRSINDQNTASVIITGRGGGSLEDLWAFNEMPVAEAVYNSKIPVISAVGHEVDFTICDFVADYRAETPSAAAVRVVPVMSELLENLAETRLNMSSLARHRLDVLRQKIEAIKNHYCFRHPLNRIREFFQRLDETRLILGRTAGSLILLKREQLKRYSGMLVSLSPLRVMERGYSITTSAKTGRPLSSLEDFTEGDEIITMVSDGRVFSQVLRKAGA